MIQAPPVDVSVVVCTRGRPDSLRRALESIDGSWTTRSPPAEIVVVDNGSEAGRISMPDDARAGKFPLVEVCEPQVGLSKARNRGVGASSGRFVLFTDDDVQVPRGWIENLCAPLFLRDAEAVAGGVRLAVPTPEGLGSLSAWLATTDGISSADPDRMVGANMAVTRQALARVGGFDVELGAGRLGFGEETLMAYQIREAGMRLVSRFDVAVDHHPDLSRVTRKTMLDHARRLGQSDAYVAHHWRHDELRSTAAGRSRQRIGLWRRRLTSPAWLTGRLGPERWELYRAYNVAWSDYFLKLQGSPRKYAKRGLTKLRGEGAAGVGVDDDGSERSLLIAAERRV